MGAPQITLIALMALSGGVVLSKSGQPREGNHSFGAWLFAAALQIGIMYWGGFFS